MRKIFLILTFISIVLQESTFAGFLTGNSTPITVAPGQYAFKLSASLIMLGTPVTAVCLTGKYSYDEKINIFAKGGKGTIDYATVSGTRQSNEPVISGFGFDYLLSGSKKAEFSALTVGYETVSWSINKVSNISNEIMIGIDYCYLVGTSMKTRYRLALHNFNSGFESEEKIATSLKYSLSTEIDYSFTNNFSSSFETGIYFGDKGGLIAFFGLGVGYNI
jgi:hypothetical protein